MTDLDTKALEAAARALCRATPPDRYYGPCCEGGPCQAPWDALVEDGIPEQAQAAITAYLQTRREEGYDKAVVGAVLASLFDRKGIGDILQSIQYDDPEVWEDIVDGAVQSLATLTEKERE